MLLQRHPQPSLNSAQYRAVDYLGITRPVDYHATRTVLRGDLAKALAEPFVESSVEALKSVVDTRSRRCPSETNLSRQIEDHGQVRDETPESQAMELGEIFKRYTPAVALIGERRVGEAIGHHPNPLCERRRNQPGYMVAPGGEQQQSLAERIPSLAVAFEKEAPNGLAARRSSRFARRPCRDPRAPERRHEKLHLGRFADAFAALDRDKPAARHEFSVVEVQCRWPQTR